MFTNEDSSNSTDLEENPINKAQKIIKEENSTKKLRKIRSDKKLEKVKKDKKKPNHTLYSCDICGKMYQNQHLPYHLNAHNSKFNLVPFIGPSELF